MPSPEPLAAALESSPLLAPADRILVAVSGGPDSTALLIALQEAGHDVTAAHYDHALQPTSAAAAEHVARLCARLGVPLICERRREPMPRGSMQAAARELRYEFLVRAARAAGASKIALAHTADDVVEGTVIHLLRGCGIAGLRGMPAARDVFVRPLLDVWRADVRAFLAVRGVVALEDPANSDERFGRVAVRRTILPALEAARPGITRRLRAVASRAAALQEAVELSATAAIEDDAIPTASLARLPEPVAAEALETLYARSGVKRPALSRRHLAAMLRIARGGPGGRGIDLPGGRRFRVVGSRAQIVPRVTPSMDARLLVKDCSGCDAPGSVHLRRGLDLRLGHRRPGLRLRPSASPGTRKLQDLFVDAKVPREDRDGWPLVFAGDRLAWVPGLAVDRDLESRAGEPSLHVTVTRILAAGMTPKDAMLESPDSPRGESS